MTDLTRALLELIRSAVSGSPKEIPATVDPVALFRIVHRLHLSSFLWESGSRLPASSVRDAWEKDRDLSAMQDLLQTEEKESVDAALSAAGIRFLYLKGSVLKPLWGDPSFRYMGDADFLFEGDDAALQSALEKLGYTAEIFGSRDYSHHFVFRKEPWFVLEPHFALFDSDDPFAETLAGLFDRATPDDTLPGRYLISEEDLYLHCLLHARKHIVGSGIGVRSFLDFAFLLREYPDLSERARVREVLSGAGLDVFESRVLRVARLLSDPTLTPDEEDEREITMLFEIGLFGSTDDLVEKRLLAERERSRFPRLAFFIKRFFPPLISMAHRKIRAPLSWIVYPFFWLRRVFLFLFTRSRRSRLKASFRALASTEEKTKDAGFELSYFGLSPENGKGADPRD